jgi:hypothetical protein
VETATEKNSFRMSSYHRLDVSVSFRKKKRWGERTWVVGLYNAYWHQNPFYIAVEEDYTCDATGCGRGDRVVKEYSILPVIPSVAYNFKF